jgi:hypothetical protein
VDERFGQGRIQLERKSEIQDPVWTPVGEPVRIQPGVRVTDDASRTLRQGFYRFRLFPD